VSRYVCNCALDQKWTGQVKSFARTPAQMYGVIAGQSTLLSPLNRSNFDRHASLHLGSSILWSRQDVRASMCNKGLLSPAKIVSPVITSILDMQTQAASALATGGDTRVT
jgi:hypothetical protein